MVWVKLLRQVVPVRFLIHVYGIYPSGGRGGCGGLLRGNRDFAKRLLIRGECGYGPTRLLVFDSECEIARLVMTERGVALMFEGRVEGTRRCRRSWCSLEEPRQTKWELMIENRAKIYTTQVVT